MSEPGPERAGALPVDGDQGKDEQTPAALADEDGQKPAAPADEDGQTTPASADEDEGPQGRERPTQVEASDRELMVRVRDGDVEAFRRLFDRQHRRVYLTAYQILGERGVAEDVAQDTFLTLWRKAASYDPRYALSTWLTRIAANRAIDRWRKEGREVRVSEEASGGSRRSGARSRGTGAGSRSAEDVLSGAPTGTVSRSHSGRAWMEPRIGRADAGSDVTPTSRLQEWGEVQRIWDELAELLPPARRAAFVLREIEGLTTAEVADALDCSPSTVRSHLSLARKELQRALRERYPEYAPPD